jgi:hypothetical protein
MGLGRVGGEKRKKSKNIFALFFKCPKSWQNFLKKGIAIEIQF